MCFRHAHKHSGWHQLQTNELVTAACIHFVWLPKRQQHAKGSICMVDINTSTDWIQWRCAFEANFFSHSTASGYGDWKVKLLKTGTTFTARSTSRHEWASKERRFAVLFGFVKASTDNAGSTQGDSWPVNNSTASSCQLAHASTLQFLFCRLIQTCSKFD